MGIGEEVMPKPVPPPVLDNTEKKISIFVIILSRQ